VPSILESFGLVILESMQLQRPVIASAVQGVSEVIADGKTGLLVPGQDPSALCRAIQTLLSQPERAIQMGLEGRKRAMGFTIDRNADQYEDLYRELKGSRG
jgi:starch synthase